MLKINANSNIKDIIEQYPETLPVFATSGFRANEKEELSDEFGEGLLLKTALNLKGINQKIFIKMLEEKISLKLEKLEELIQAEAGNPSVKFNFTGYTYWPLRPIFKDFFEDALSKYLAKTGDTDFNYHIPSDFSGDDPCSDIWKAKSMEQLPDVIAGAGFGDFFREEFVDRFINKGYFKAAGYDKMNQAFVSAGIPDPDNCYTVYSVLPLIMLIDKKKLGKLPVPAQWSDLLNPVYRNNIIIGASSGEVHEDLLLYIYKEYGEEGLKMLSRNIKTGWHASLMAKVAGTSSNEGAAIYVIPWMFAKACQRTEATQIIWPVDGALTTPMYLLVKAASFDKYKVFADFVINSAYGKLSASNYFPVLNGKVDNRLPEGAVLKWLGWDYIKANSMEKLKKYVVAFFYKHHDENQPKEAAIQN
ncbi:ABC-type Fe3+ transport system substrate-binding protein [Ruminiclostridium sufflavum DSM 19573]|uniref:ABC-type Fe3+ transport system substrate-binding protein n=1 Tax=Ruminiclostridium sufflavum DSM 19573 TaxID=1121337 RepID=A0A318XPF0_9FIRM|nr:ABC transporter substrate-binding protein [Ruminiclostridium sufflavum]PYG90216.1 ABC-type Fe3+ transport system substrate-binding protein [Ruminiclostridium sufflavum DSM 19573]